MKAIELVYRAQPIVAAFRQIASQSQAGKRGVVVESCDNLILMLRLGGKSYCDIEISRKTWGVRQCYLKGNTAAPREVWELASEVAAFLKKEHRRFSKLGMFKTTQKKAA